MTRRRDVLGITAGLAASALPVDASKDASAASDNRRTFVLVHGAWHGGWCWRYVAEILRAGGHTVFTPTLTGLGERVHLRAPEVDFETHVTDIMNVIEFEELDRFVLVGHSYGG
ncbi:MAG: alpha/beta fold hydrolase, partial [Rhodobacteraceae bacterium]|nr:alpha/beta fold hydrolase [Paracoccaceae bacterium]